MMIQIFILIIASLATTILITINPLTLGLMILMMALFLSIVVSVSMSSWLAFLIFLIYIGGMLVMFSYFVSIIPNQTISLMYNLTAFMMSMVFLYVISSFMKFTNEMSSNNLMKLDTFYNQENTQFLIMLALILLFTMVVVVKVTTMKKGPLRSFIYYV